MLQQSINTLNSIDKQVLEVEECCKAIQDFLNNVIKQQQTIEGYKLTLKTSLQDSIEEYKSSLKIGLTKLIESVVSYKNDENRMILEKLLSGEHKYFIINQIKQLAEETNLSTQDEIQISTSVQDEIKQTGKDTEEVPCKIYYDYYKWVYYFSKKKTVEQVSMKEFENLIKQPITYNKKFKLEVLEEAVAAINNSDSWYLLANQYLTNFITDNENIYLYKALECLYKSLQVYENKNIEDYKKLLESIIKYSLQLLNKINLNSISQRTNFPSKQEDFSTKIIMSIEAFFDLIKSIQLISKNSQLKDIGNLLRSPYREFSDALNNYYLHMVLFEIGKILNEGSSNKKTRDVSNHFNTILFNNNNQTLLVKLENISDYAAIAIKQNKTKIICQNILDVIDNPKIAEEPKLRILLEIKKNFNNPELNKAGEKLGIKIVPETVKKVRLCLKAISLFSNDFEQVYDVIKKILGQRIRRYTNSDIEKYKKYKQGTVIIGNDNEIAKIVLYIQTCESLDIKVKGLEADEVEKKWNSTSIALMPTLSRTLSEWPSYIQKLFTEPNNYAECVAIIQNTQKLLNGAKTCASEFNELTLEKIQNDLELINSAITNALNNSKYNFQDSDSKEFFLEDITFILGIYRNLWQVNLKKFEPEDVTGSLRARSTSTPAKRPKSG